METLRAGLAVVAGVLALNVIIVVGVEDENTSAEKLALFNLTAIAFGVLVWLMLGLI